MTIIKFGAAALFYVGFIYYACKFVGFNRLGSNAPKPTAAQP